MLNYSVISEENERGGGQEELQSSLYTPKLCFSTPYFLL